MHNIIVLILEELKHSVTNKQHILFTHKIQNSGALHVVLDPGI